MVRGEGGPALFGKERVSFNCQSTVFLDKTACVSYGQGQDYLGEGVCPWPPRFPISVWKEVREVGARGGDGDNGLIQVDMGILLVLGRMLDVTMATSSPFHGGVR